MDLKLKAEKRERKEKLENDFVAGVIYGPSSEPESLKLNRNEFVKVYKVAGESNLIELDFNGKKVNVLVKDTQKHQTKDNFIHIDFYEVDMTKTITTEIPLNFVGESKAVKALGGLLVKNMDELSVECLPLDLVDHVDVDISVLDEIGKSIHVEDISISSKIKVFNNPRDLVASIIEQKDEDDKKTEVAEVKVDDSKKKESAPSSTDKK
ncbi:MAG: 50S ribosomal protein L25 [Patescibacteria group bacterium]